jgi:hypothetical protein
VCSFKSVNFVNFGIADGFDDVWVDEDCAVSVRKELHVIGLDPDYG